MAYESEALFFFFKFNVSVYSLLVKLKARTQTSFFVQTETLACKILDIFNV